MDRAEFYVREAQRLRDLAEGMIFADMRLELIRVAERYDVMARQHRDASAAIVQTAEN